MVKLEMIANNQTIVYTNSGVEFHSYESFICEIKYGELVKIGYNWNYSRTTIKYLKQFLDKYLPNLYKTKASFEKLIEEKYIYNENGYYELKNN